MAMTRLFFLVLAAAAALPALSLPAREQGDVLFLLPESKERLPFQSYEQLDIDSDNISEEMGTELVAPHHILIGNLPRPNFIPFEKEETPVIPTAAERTSKHAITKRSLLPRLRPRLFSSKRKTSQRATATEADEANQLKKRALSIFMALPGLEETIPESAPKVESASSRGRRIRPYGMPLRWG